MTNYKRKYKKQKRNMKKNYYRKVSGQEMAASMGVAGYNLAKKALSFLNVEFKDLSNVYSITTSAGGSITPLNGLASGAGLSQRNGNQVEFKAINMHGRIKVDPTTPTSATVRIILFKAKAPNGVTPSMADLLDNVAAPNYQAFYNLDNVPQSLQILQDKRFDINHLDKHLHSFDIRYNDNDIKTRYQGNTSAAGDISTNGIYLAVVASSFSGTNFPTVDLTSRLRYLDN